MALPLRYQFTVYCLVSLTFFCAQTYSTMSLEHLIQTFIFTPISIISSVIILCAYLIHICTLVVISEPVLPQLYYKDSALARFLIESVKGLSEPYFVIRCLKNKHVQTLIAPTMSLNGDVKFEREFLQLKDRGLVSLDWTVPPHYTNRKNLNLKGDNPILLLIPGLLFRDSSSFGTMCMQAISSGFRPVVFNRRGWAGNPLSTCRIQTFGDPNDLRQAVKYIKVKYPLAKLSALGVSSGGGLLISYLGEYGSSVYLSAAVVVSSTWDIEQIMNNSPTSLYSTIWSLTEKQFICSHAGVLQKVLSIHSVLFSTNIQVVEKNAYLPFSGCSNLEQYWEDNNPIREVDEISIPLLAIHSEDDPVIDKQTVPTDLFSFYPNLFLVVTPVGGHCGFVTNTLGQLWWTQLSIDYIQQSLKFMELHKGNNVIKCSSDSVKGYRRKI